jgi:UDP-2-acetamido-3-amino-2,3-dideoxy-glucuronate N-acetyltransferase
MTNRIAVVGAGYWGKNLIRNMHQLSALAAICESDPRNPNLAPYKDVKLFTNYGDLLADRDIEGVVISTPAEMHYDMVREALDAGKHVFVEKPLCLSEQHGVALNELARRKHRVLMVGHLLQYHPAFLKLLELVRKAELGKIQYIYSNRLNLGKIRTEENILWSFAPHDISVILSLAGEMPEDVSTTGGHYLTEKIADVTLSSLSFPNGIKGHIFVSWLHPYKEQKLIVVGSKGMAVFDDMAKPEEKLLVYPHRIDWKEGNIPTPVKENAVPVVYDVKEPLNEECRHFIDCIKSGTVPRTDGEEGLRVLKILNACQRSLDQHGLSISPGEPQRSYYLHPTAFVDEPSNIGEGTSIWHFSHILKGSRIGKECKIGQNVVIGPNAVIGNNVKIQNNVSVYEGVLLEDHVFCGPSMVFTNINTPRSAYPRNTAEHYRKTVVKRCATIGANATIVCGHTLGEHSFIGAGAVVTTDIPAYAIAYGNPAKVHGWACECGVRLDFSGSSASCPECTKKYSKENETTIKRTD